MKTILCPTDFTPSADSVSKYAAQLARDTDSKVILVATHPKKEKVAAGDFESNDDAERLSELHDLLAGIYHVACGEEEPINGNIYKKLSAVADHYDLLVLGSHFGKEDGRKYSSGIDLVKMIQETLVPFLIVPENFNYKKVSRLLYAYDYKHEPDPPLMALHWLADWFDVDVQFISVIPSNISVQEENNINQVQGKILHNWHHDRKLGIETIVYDNVAQCLKNYLNRWSEGELLVLSVNHQNLLKKIWHKSVVKNLLTDATHPYMIIHK